MAMQGRHLNRTEVLAWNEPWSTRDRIWISAALDAIPNGVNIVPPSDGQIGVWINDRRALIVFPGFRLHTGGPGMPELRPEICRRCFMELPQTGVCDCR